MKNYYLIILVIITLCCTACSKKDEVIIDKNVDSITLLNNLDDYVEYKSDLIDNKKLILTFNFRNDVSVPDNPPVVEVKVYLWMNDDVIGIYHKSLYNNYEDYLNSVKLTFDADGKEFNKFEVSFEGNTK
ncbi:hypothetical protein [Anaerocolumna chitinilytica]|uniref:Uncharacterized protein n=1 Tax=Anaerocolumna chitinilytica TaxID=1727145 RepID=A0A7I8DPX1_9FIRM|nr:hypothetical protein [Anaerocolumna chitinilytica]BCJ99717.1 hypothetical protein bsdcttw_27580 [Anaerocolumna chitinilytica]